jgi:hypothetical protein
MDRQWGVYVIGRPGETKIGMTNNLPKRISNIQNGNAVSLTLHAFFPVEHRQAATHLERWAHYAVIGFHATGEWFSITGRKAVYSIEKVAQRDYLFSNGIWVNRNGDYGNPPVILASVVALKVLRTQKADPTTQEQRRQSSKKHLANLYANPEYRKKRKERMRVLYTDPQYRERQAQARKAGNQRNLIRTLYAKYGDLGREQIFSEFEQAMLQGEIVRANNTGNQSWRRYANFLLAKGKREGWIYRHKTVN